MKYTQTHVCTTYTTTYLAIFQKCAFLDFYTYRDFLEMKNADKDPFQKTLFVRSTHIYIFFCLSALYIYLVGLLTDLWGAGAGR